MPTPSLPLLQRDLTLKCDLDYDLRTTMLCMTNLPRVLHDSVKVNSNTVYRTVTEQSQTKNDLSRQAGDKLRNGQVVRVTTRREDIGLSEHRH